MGTALKLAQDARSFQLPGSDRVATSDPAKSRRAHLERNRGVQERNRATRAQFFRRKPTELRARAPCHSRPSKSNTTTTTNANPNPPLGP
jgi:hypothetical protein